MSGFTVIDKGRHRCAAPNPEIDRVVDGMVIECNGCGQRWRWRVGWFVPRWVRVKRPSA